MDPIDETPFALPQDVPPLLQDAEESLYRVIGNASGVRRNMQKILHLIVRCINIIEDLKCSISPPPSTFEEMITNIESVRKLEILLVKFDGAVTTEASLPASLDHGMMETWESSRKEFYELLKEAYDPEFKPSDSWEKGVEQVSRLDDYLWVSLIAQDMRGKGIDAAQKAEIIAARFLEGNQDPSNFNRDIETVMSDWRMIAESVTLPSTSENMGSNRIRTHYSTYEGVNSASPSSSYHSLAETLGPQVVAFPDPANPNDAQEAATGSYVAPSGTKIPVPDPHPATKDPVPFRLPHPGLGAPDSSSVTTRRVPDLHIVTAGPSLKEPGLSSRSFPQWATGTSSLPSPALPPEESIIQPGISIPIYDLPSQLEGTLKKTRRIPSGTYSDVYIGEWTPPNEEPVSVAIKCIRRVGLGYDTEEQETEARFEKRIKREVVVWQTAKHDNILEFYGFQIIDGEPMFVSPWCTNGNLREYIKLHPELADVKKLELLRDAAQGLSYLHSLEPPIIHGDITPDNVLVTNDIRGVLCDFGISRVMTSLGTHTGLTTAGQGRGAAGYQAKELYEEDSRPTPMSDVYAFGGVILATMSGKAPFHKKGKAVASIILAINMDRTANPADHPKLSNSDPLWGLINTCWDPQPDRRPRVQEIVAELDGQIQRRSESQAPPS